jgi:hypothetical protein
MSFTLLDINLKLEISTTGNKQGKPLQKKKNPLRIRNNESGNSDTTENNFVPLLYLQLEFSNQNLDEN